jgi:signal transduction histidine kinase
MSWGGGAPEAYARGLRPGAEGWPWQASLARTVLQVMREAVFGTAPADAVAYANPAARELLARLGRVGAVEGQPLAELLGLADDTPLRRCLGGGGGTVHVQLHCRGPAGSRLLDCRLSGVSGPRGEPGLLLLGLDRTEEWQRAAEARRQERLAALGQLAAGAAHEIRNPLTAVRGFLQLVDGRCRPEQQAKYLEIVRRELDRIERITSDLLLLARPWRSEPVDCDVAAVLAKAADVVRGRADAFGIEIAVRAAPGVPPVKADPDRLEQVFLNLLLNAVEAMSGPGTITAELQLLPDGYVEAAIRDQGPGVPAEILPHLFEPFCTTKAGGTGLGLAVSDSIVRGLGGHIVVTSLPGAGATFAVRLPAARREAPAG